jgi:hypothetical protein
MQRVIEGDETRMYAPKAGRVRLVRRINRVLAVPVALPVMREIVAVIDDPTHRAAVAVANALIVELSRAAPLAMMHVALGAMQDAAMAILTATPFF